MRIDNKVSLLILQHPQERNAWMLKCKRVVLAPKRPSRYGKLRREPRNDGLSTIEAAAMLCPAGTRAGDRDRAAREL